MTTLFTKRVLGGSFARVTALGLLALAAVLLRPSEAKAQWATSGTNTTTTNNVGIGTAAPSQMFHVHSVGTWAGTRVTTAATGTTINDGVHFGYDDAYGAYIWNREATSVVISTSNLERMRVSPTGNIGIGTTTPGVVNGFNFAPYISMHVQTPGGGAGSIAVDSSNPASGIVLNDSSQPVDSRMWSISQAAGGGKLSFRTYADSGTAPSDKLVIDRSGNIGVGTAAPQSLLDIQGPSGMTLRTTAASSGFSFFDRASVPGDQVVFQGNKGNYSLFNVSTRGANVGTEKGSGMAFWTVDIANTANATQFQMHYAPQYGPVFFTQKFGTGAQGDKKISFQTAWQNTAVAPSQLVLDTSGYVGIGTTNPLTRLHVAGSITVDGNINAKYQDVAEWVPSTQKLSAGTVVILDTGRDNHVLASKGSYDTRVAGVISAQPGLSLGEAGEGKVLVATTGRVKVKVDANRAPIKIGDLIVTSDLEGVAMKSVPVELGGVALHRPGTLIGKALESLEKGTGEILVLLSLQ